MRARGGTLHRACRLPRELARRRDSAAGAPPAETREPRARAGRLSCASAASDLRRCASPRRGGGTSRARLATDRRVSTRRSAPSRSPPQRALAGARRGARRRSVVGLASRRPWGRVRAGRAVKDRTPRARGRCGGPRRSRACLPRGAARGRPSRSERAGVDAAAGASRDHPREPCRAGAPLHPSGSMRR